MSTIGKRIHKIIEEKELTLEQFGAPLGVSRSGVSKWINDITKDLKNENLIRIEKHWGINVRWLLTGEGPKDVKDLQESPSRFSPEVQAIAELCESLDASGRRALFKTALKKKNNCRK